MEKPKSLLQQLVAMVQPQDFPHKEEFLDAVAAGRCKVREPSGAGDGPTADGSQLLDTYRFRWARMAEKRSAHAQVLASDTAWFCANLEATPLGRVVVWSVAVDHPYELAFFLDAESDKVLGCLKTVSQLEVTPEEWKRLWSEE